MKLGELYFYFTLISAASVIVPITFSLIKLSAFNKQLKALFIYLLLSLINDSICFAMFLMNQETLIPIEIYSTLQCFLIFYIFSKEFKLSTPIITIAQLIMFCLFGLTFIIPNLKFEIIEGAESFLICSLAFYFFYKVFKKLLIPVLTEYYFFWVNTAFLFYFGTTFILVLFDFYIRNSGNIGVLLWSIQLMTNIIHNFLLTIGIWKVQKT